MPKQEAKSNTAKGSTTSSKTDAPEQSLTDIQAKADQETAQGFRGAEVDPTPNENYTVAGVTSGAPTPETDVDAAKEVRTATGLGMSPLEAADREKTQRGEK